MLFPRIPKNLIGAGLDKTVVRSLIVGSTLLFGHCKASGIEALGLVDSGDAYFLYGNGSPICKEACSPDDLLISKVNP